MEWVKFPGERLVVPVDWNTILGGEQINGDITVDVEPTPTTVVVTVLDTVRGYSQVRLEGGVAYETVVATFTFLTTGGQILTPNIRLSIKPLAGG